MTRSLFRREATEAQRQRLYGEVVLVQPLGFSLLTGFLFAVLVAAAIFLATGSFARKERAVGYLVPDTGIVHVFAPRGGIVSEIRVSEGATVAAGDPLITVRTERVSTSGEALELAMLRQIQVQIDEITTQIALAGRRLPATRAALAARLEGLDAERRELAAQRRVQERLVAVARENLEAIADLSRRGLVAETEYKARQEQVLAYEQQVAALDQRLAVNRAERRQAQAALDQSPIEAEEHLSQLAAQRAALLLRKAELEGAHAVTLTAPVSGRVTALQAVVGARADGRLLLAILPAGGVMQAQLYVPTRAIGFVAPGQEVRLAYDAFDYRRFGMQRGVVRAVSATILSPDEVPGPLRPSEPVYRVTVALERESVRAYGTEVPLQAGMTLSADIVLERRSLLAWLLDPLRSLGGRG